ncbi:hypothetical protein M422DRAFT_159102 [Sphaerobolus stellatus SS14]|nr:hypothetical protein M422DRAFT_159102 [Sphaerobolus stellatus SS14]
MSELPTASQLAEARQSLTNSEQALEDVSQKINDAEEELAAIIEVTRRKIDALNAEKTSLQEEIALTLAYVSPIRRLPSELLRAVFLIYFDHDPRCAWTLASVCSLWRRISLSMPKLWSKIRLETTQDSSADTIRLWLERSGLSCPLDIEITLQVAPPQSKENKTRRGRASSYPGLPSPPMSWAAVPVHHGQMNIGTAGGGIVHYIPSSVFPPLVLSPSPPNSQASTPGPSTQAARSVTHWGHIAMFYLTQQMERWERFVFKFDKTFGSMSALRSITGNAPLLKHFEIGCQETGGYYFDSSWAWMPTQSPEVPSLQSISICNMPFKWSSSMFTTSSLKELTLRALPISTLNLDRIQHILTCNAQTLTTVSLSFPSAQAPILPLNPFTLPSLSSLSLSGHHLLAALLDHITAPALENLALRLDMSRNHEPLEETLSNLLTRSGRPPVTSLNITHGPSSLFYGTPNGMNGPLAPWSFLAEIPTLSRITMSQTAIEPLLELLAGPDEDLNAWLCPELTSLTFISCHQHNEGVVKLVNLIEARNPSNPHANAGLGLGLTGGVKRITHLDLRDTISVGMDVLSWLQSRVENVSVVEPICEKYVMNLIVSV